MMSVVNSLLVLSCLMTLEFYTTVAANTCPAKSDIVFILDSSGSIGLENYKKQLQFAADVTKIFNIGPNDVQFGAVVFNYGARKLFDLKDNTNSESLEKEILKARYLGGATHTDKAIKLVLDSQMFSISAGGRPDAKKIAIIMTDGISQNTTRTLEAAAQLKANGVAIITIGIGSADQSELLGMASSNQNVFTVDNVDALKVIQKNFEERTCKVTEGKVVAYTCPAKSDIVFILDSSGSIGLENYKKQLQFAADLTKIFDIGPNDVQFGAVVFSYDAKNVFDLKDNTSPESLEREILKAPYLRGTTHTDKAIKLVLDSQMFSISAGGRPDAKKIVIIMTDGISQHPTRTLEAAAQLKANGVAIITIGIGSADQSELLGMASSNQNVFTVDNVDALKVIQKNFEERTCKVTEGKVAADKYPVKSDIVFILDFSGRVGLENCKKQLQFAADLTRTFNIGTNNVQFGAVVFSNDARKLFDLKENTSPESLEREILKAPFLDSTAHTDKAIKLVLDSQMFSISAGGRPDAKKIVIIMTYGISQNTTRTLEAAAQLKANGVAIITIGIGRADQSELHGMASSDQNVFTVDNVDDLKAIQNKIGERTSQVSKEKVVADKFAAKSNIVFILDSSGRVGLEIYKKQLQFAADLTKTFNIGTNVVQFGVVVFSNDARKLFDLKDNTSPESLEREILKAPILDSTTNTDKAIKLVLDSQMFSISAGGRPDASKIVIIMTYGISQNPSRTLQAADQLKASGVNVIAIGIGKVSLSELRGMASSEQNVFTADNVDDLSGIQKKVWELTYQAEKLLIPGLINIDGQCFLSLHRDLPSLNKEGLYQCKITGPDRTGNSVETNKYLENTISNMKTSLENVITKQTTLENALANLTKIVTQKLERPLSSQKLTNKLFVQTLQTQLQYFYISEEYDGKYYLLSKNFTVSVNNSQTLCRQAGGYLVEIDNAGENDFIQKFLNTRTATRALTGGTDEGQADQWIWRTSQRPVTYTNWNSNEPVNTANYNCLWLYKRRNWLWSAHLCERGHFLCEVPTM